MSYSLRPQKDTRGSGKCLLTISAVREQRVKNYRDDLGPLAVVGSATQGKARLRRTHPVTMPHPEATGLLIGLRRPSS
ncbi:hypothetical protein NDU88_002823 [Pleurodeles waltl]|uniref:Uncharacterized protein n=1 Tax=Pleurodeles waltl TaxID=8319 RepID=A0AAV7KUU6_PLEWA|nr:hypothetical protein NDU88_002823 [Pleurodeles waltl]